MTHDPVPPPLPDPLDVVDQVLSQDARAAAEARLPSELRARILAAAAPSVSNHAPRRGRVFDLFARIAACAASFALVAFATPEVLHAAETAPAGPGLTEQLFGSGPWATGPLDERMLSTAQAGMDAAVGLDPIALGIGAAVFLATGWFLSTRGARS